MNRGTFMSDTPETYTVLLYSDDSTVRDRLSEAAAPACKPGQKLPHIMLVLDEWRTRLQAAAQAQTAQTQTAQTQIAQTQIAPPDAERRR